MTREEAIKILSDEELSQLIEEFHGAKEALDLAISALRGPTRETVERMRGEWIGMTDDDGCTWLECSRCEYDLDSLEVPNHFCPACGAPITDEAVDILLERLKEALK